MYVCSLAELYDDIQKSFETFKFSKRISARNKTYEEEELSDEDEYLCKLFHT